MKEELPEIRRWVGVCPCGMEVPFKGPQENQLCPSCEEEKIRAYPAGDEWVIHAEKAEVGVVDGTDTNIYSIIGVYRRAGVMDRL